MLGQKLFTPKVVHEVNLEERVPEDHLLRRVAEVVDFSFVRRLTVRFYSHTGQPGIDPVVLFKMALLGYLYGITSERRLAEELRLHLAFMWFIGYDLDERTPDHSVLSKARRRFGVTVYQAFFTEIVRQCERAGLIDGRTLYLDSTLVKANAALGSQAARALVAQLASVDEHVAALWRENPNSGEQAEAPDPTRDPSTLPNSPTPTTPEVMASTALHLATRADPPNGPQGAINTLVVSRTDPDAGLVARDGVPLGFYYKAHLGVDGGRPRIITAVEVTPGEVADKSLLERLLKEHVGVTHRQVEEVVADTKYGTHVNYVRLEAAGIRATIPPHSATRERGAYRADQFVYEAEADRTDAQPASTCVVKAPRTRPERRAASFIVASRRSVEPARSRASAARPARHARYSDRLAAICENGPWPTCGLQQHAAAAASARVGARRPMLN